MMRRLQVAVLLVGAGVGVTYAGTKAASNTYGVFVSVAGRSASGALGQVRNNTNNNEYIACYVNSLSDGSTSGLCWANDQSNNSVQCSLNTALVAAARSINPDSYIQFSFDANGNCTALYVQNNSYFAPKQL
jgi:hypothetical protein